MQVRSTTRWAVAAAAALVLGATACATQEKPAPPPPSTTGSEFRDQPVRPDAPRRTGKAVPSLEPVYFDFDRYEIRPDARPLLRANAQAIVDNEQWGTIIIEGHCDERGSEEYNLALGEKRARAVRRYLSDLGVPSVRLDIVSFGEAKPAVMGHDESAWRYHRRSEFKKGS
jgi:peptidoglycan-associated lipoprotein